MFLFKSYCPTYLLLLYLKNENLLTPSTQDLIYQEKDIFFLKKILFLSSKPSMNIIISLKRQSFFKHDFSGDVAALPVLFQIFMSCTKFSHLPVTIYLLKKG